MSFPPPNQMPPGGMPPQGMPGQGAVGVAAPPNNMVLAIISTVVGFLCCCPFGAIPGVVAIVKANSVGSMANVGDFAGASAAAEDAKKFAYIAFGMAVIGIILNIVLRATGVVDGTFDFSTTP